MAYNFSTKICYTCGRRFIPAPMNVFKRKIGGRVWHFCSYGCLNSYTRTQKSTNNLTEENPMCYNKEGGDITNDSKSTEK